MSLWILLASILLLLFGSSMSHLGYRALTPDSLRQAKADQYQFLSEAELLLTGDSGPQREQMQAERLGLYYWFHARGWSIDEGDESRSWLHPWRELLVYWRGSDETTRVPLSQ